MRRTRISPFRGVVTSLDARNIPPGAAQDIRDMRVEDGVLRSRYGFGTLLDSVTNQTTNKMFSYVQGFSSQSFIDAVLSVDVVSGTAKLYEIDCDLWRRTEVTNGTNTLSLNNTYWRCAAFDNKAYIWNYNSAGTSSDPGPMMQYTIGDYDSLTRVAPPTGPSTLTVVYAKNNSGGSGYEFIRWTGADPLNPAADVTYTSPAQATSSSLSGEAFSIAHAASALGKAKVRIDLNAITAGIQDLTNNDVFTFTLTIPNTTFQIDPQSVRIYFETSGGTRTELKTIVEPTTDNSGNVVRVECYAKFQTKTRTTWATTRYVELEYDVSRTSGTAVNNLLRFNPLLKGCIVDWRSGENEFQGWKYGYEFYDSATGYGSGVTAEVELNESKLRGETVVVKTSLALGTIPTLTTTTSGSADKIRIYAARRVDSKTRERKYSKWRLVVEQDDTTTTYKVNTDAEAFNALTEYLPAPFVHDDVLCAGQFKGWMVWGYRGGSGNVRHSRIGSPLLQARDSDVVVPGAIDPDDPDPNRGATFSLTDNFTDSPKGFLGLGDVLLILGDYGCYAQVGDRPVTMSPPKVVPGAPGCIGYESFCKWKDEAGNPAGVYVSADGSSVWMVTVSPAFQGDAGASVVELTAHVRGLLDSFLYGGSVLTSPEAVMVWVDKDDALNLFYNGRRMVMRRPSLVDGLRDWELYSYEDGAQGGQWNKGFYSQLRGAKVLRLTGQVDELDYNTVDDDVTAMPLWSPYTGDGLTPSTTDTTNDNVGFADDPRWASGAPVTVSATGGGLTASTTYYVRKVTFQEFDIYDSAALTSKRNITGSVTQNIRHVSMSSGGYLPFATDTTNERLTFQDGPGWIDATPVEVAVNSGGLLAADTSYVKRVSNYVRYEFYDTEAHAIDFAATTGRVNLTASITATITPAGRDAGHVVPATGLYWRSRKFAGPRRRVDAVYVDREDLTESVTVSVKSGRQSAVSRTVGAGARNARFSSAQVDEVHDFKVAFLEDNDPVYGLEVMETPLSARRHA